MTSSPVLISSHPHTPMKNSPNASPHLKASKSGNMTPLSLSPSSTPRSFARAPPARPYQSALCARGCVPGLAPEGDTKAFADRVCGIVHGRSSKVAGPSASASGRKSLGGSLEAERAELIVDYPAWSPGSFQDLSTLHALRDTTLSHAHSVLSYLQSTHNIPASYRLLARSASAVPTPGSSPSAISPFDGTSSGWGCIRLAPTAVSPVLRPAVRRSSAVTAPIRFHRPTTMPLDFEHAIADEYDDDDHDADVDKEVKLRAGYSSGTASDDEDEEESADVLVAREVDKRGGKEGMVFLMTLFGQPALILT
ncbi:hypothetical protein BCR39DRAFT_555567 [Naematelia encephala]|uniref:Uncharacterized protein n=1 Tax=Naematelia encephala TaxID=71784 RepID=A0A1Y2BMM9_9TREE|nr:hypothetical protein BCR39DRAFT_555567 [Naematelia encephala]